MSLINHSAQIAVNLNNCFLQYLIVGNKLLIQESLLIHKPTITGYRDKLLRFRAEH